MKIFFPSNFPLNIREFLLKTGYTPSYHTKTDQLNFVRRLTSAPYPHFHIYIEKDNTGQSYISLHLDQKQPSYKGFRSHNAEHYGTVVENEAKRIKECIDEKNAEKISSIHDEKKNVSFFRKFFNLE